jgi:hypothetical protein
MTTPERDFAARVLGGTEVPDVDAARARIMARSAKPARRTAMPASRILGVAALLALAIALAGPATAVVRNVINAVVFNGARIATQPESMGSILRSFTVDRHFHFAPGSRPQRCVSNGLEARRVTGLRLPIVAHLPSGVRAARCAYQVMLGGTQTYALDPLVAQSHGLTLPGDLAKATVVFADGRGLLQHYVDAKDSRHRYMLQTLPEQSFIVHGATLAQLVAWYSHELNTTPGQRRTMSDLLMAHPTNAWHPEFPGIPQGGHVAESSVNGSPAFAFTNLRMAALTWFAPGRIYTFFGPPDSIDELHRMAESVTTP